MFSAKRTTRFCRERERETDRQTY